MLLMEGNGHVYVLGLLAPNHNITAYNQSSISASYVKIQHIIKHVHKCNTCMLCAMYCVAGSCEAIYSIICVQECIVCVSAYMNFITS